MLAIETMECVETEGRASRLRTGAETRTLILCAVSDLLQLKYQDLKITVTNWVRIRPNRAPNYLS